MRGPCGSSARLPRGSSRAKQPSRRRSTGWRITPLLFARCAGWSGEWTSSRSVRIGCRPSSTRSSDARREWISPTGAPSFLRAATTPLSSSRQISATSRLTECRSRLLKERFTPDREQRPHCPSAQRCGSVDRQFDRMACSTVSRDRIHNPQWGTTEVPHLRIVDDELWAQVKARQAEMRRVRLTKCAECGGRSPASANDHSSSPPCPAMSVEHWSTRSRTPSTFGRQARQLHLRRNPKVWRGRAR
jgi:hypothetical protein